MSRRRALVVVIDACGVGALPDADRYGDAGTNTLAHVAEAVGGLRVPTLEGLGLGCIVPLAGVRAVPDPAIHGRLHPLGPGKDSIAGHWELMGVVAAHAAPTYPQGFPADLVAELVRATGHEMICNLPYDGVAAIDDFGADHLRGGGLILYTSQDSVLQLAAHVERVPEAELHRACEAARAVMTGEHAVGRVIARPFSGAPGAFQRTDGRRDLALRPPRRSYLEELGSDGVPVHAVGKVADLFAGVGIDHSHPGPTNAIALGEISRLLSEVDRGLVFANLIETDQLHGHRKDVHGFHDALREIDAAVAGWLGRLRSDDLLVLTADHGVDPAAAHSDHTREYAPLLALTGGGDIAQGESRTPPAAEPHRHDGPLADVGATVLRWLSGRETEALPGQPFVS